MADVQINLIGNNQASAAINQARADLDALAAQAKSVAITPTLSSNLIAQASSQFDAIAAKYKASPLQTQAALNFKAPDAYLGSLAQSIDSYFSKRQTPIFGSQSSIFGGEVDKYNRYAMAASLETNNLARAMTSATPQATGFQGAIGGLVNTFGPLITAVGAVKLIGVVSDLGQLGAQSLDTEKSFASVTRSIGQSPALLNQLRAAAGGTITDLRLMQLTNTALAGASSDLGNSFAAAVPKLIEGARAANTLNPSLGSVEFLFQSLVTGIRRGSPMLIDNTGITLKLGEANETYAASIGKSADALTDEERKVALLNATLAGVDRLVAQAGGSLDTMTSKALQASTATQNLKIALGELVARPYVAVVNVITSGVNEVTKTLEAIQAGAPPKYVETTAATAARDNAQAELDALIAKRQEIQDAWNAQLAATPPGAAIPQNWAAPVLADFDAQIAAAQNGVKSAQDAVVAAAPLGSIVSGVTSELDDMTSSLIDNTTWLTEFKKAADNAATSGLTSQEFAQLTGAYYRPPSAADMSDPALKAVVDETNAKLKANKTVADKAAQDYERAMKQATDNVKQNVQNALQSGQSVTRGLFDVSDFAGAGNPFAPGSEANPFEAFNRLAAVAKDSAEAWRRGVGSPLDESAKKWSAMYGKSPDEALRVVGQFERGNWTPEVWDLIDKEKLKAAIEQQIAEGANMESVVSKLTQDIGVKGLSADQLGQMLGISPTGAALKTPQEQQVALPAAAATSGTTLTVNIQPGAVAVTTGSPLDVATRIVDEIIKAFTAAEGRIGIPAPVTLAGAR